MKTIADLVDEIFQVLFCTLDTSWDGVAGAFAADDDVHEDAADAIAPPRN